MSHFITAVILPPAPEGEDIDLAAAVHNQMLPYMENCCEEPPVEFMEFCEDDECDVDERTGKRGYWQNPNAKWDWYKGAEALRLKDGSKATFAKIADIDTRRNEKAYSEACAFWDYKVNGAEKPNNLGDVRTWEDIFKPEFFIERYGDKETYARFCSDFLFRAVVTPDRDWHEVGEMGWWGVSFETREDVRDWVDHFRERFIEPYMDCTLVVLNCHI